jgi:hypothetical protein
MTLEVIGAGFPRTGTSSLKAALERLGFAPCGHMTTILHDPSRARGWLDAWARRQAGEPIDWPAVIGDERASVDAPACLFWRELAVAYPDARVILSVRDPQQWYESARETIYHSSGPGADPARLAALPPDLRAGIAAVAELVQATFWDGVFAGRFLDRDHAIGLFEAHNAAVVAALPPDRLLVWEAADGWKRLCAFLGVPAPDEPFPRVNDRAQFRERLAAIRDAAVWRERGRG